MTTGKCLDCGADRMHGVLRCKDCHGQWLTDYMSFTKPEEKQESKKEDLPCPLCGEIHKVKYRYRGVPLLECKKADDNKIYGFNIHDHYVLPDDDSPDSQAGIGPFNFSFAFKNAEDIVLWHDLITKNNSFAARIGIPNWRVAQQFQIMLRRRNEELRKEGKISGVRGVFWNLSSLFVRGIHRLFYAGPLK